MSRTPFLEELFLQPAPIIGIAGAAAMTAADIEAKVLSVLDIAQVGARRA